MNYKTLLKNVTTFVFDVDGVLTDGHLILMPNGEFVRNMHTRDGYAMNLALTKGYKVAVISGGSSKQVHNRLTLLGLTDVYMKSRDKKEDLEDLMACYDLKESEILYMGDDLPDLEVMGMVGVPCCPYNAAPEVRDASVYVSGVNGGKGCVRDVIEQTLRVQGKWEHDKAAN